MMTLASLKTAVRKGEIDTVIVAFPDVFGRLVGKRFTARHFVDGVAEHGTHGCNYLLTVNIEMDPLDGFSLANWTKGFGDFHMSPDLSTLRPWPWIPGTVIVLCNYTQESGDLVREAPRSVLIGQIERLKKLGFDCAIASELEFFLYNTTYHDAFTSDYRSLPPSSDYRIDYHTMQPARDEALFRAIRNQMEAAGIPIESSKGEWGRGQHELNFVYSDPLAMADWHVMFKQGVKEIAASHGKCVTFMPKIAASEVGSSCHIHTSLWKAGRNQFWDSRKGEPTRLFRQFLGGLMKYSPEFCYLFAPTINSYKRYQAASWAPTKMAWSHDNRTVGFRVVGAGKSFRIENRMPGADANPYLAFAGTLAAGIAGIEEDLDCGESYRGNAYEDAKLQALPRSLDDAAGLWAGSALARKTFGDDVVDYYATTARHEVTAFNTAVTDWERSRYFERI